jgi:hypothetical protein
MKTADACTYIIMQVAAYFFAHVCQGKFLLEAVSVIKGT